MIHKGHPVRKAIATYNNFVISERLEAYRQRSMWYWQRTPTYLGPIIWPLIGEIIHNAITRPLR